MDETMGVEHELIAKSVRDGADFVYFVDISHVSGEHTHGYPTAILVGMTLSPEYLLHITNTPEYVPHMILNHQRETDEFHVKEKQTDRLANDMAEYLTKKDYSAFSQSENNLSLAGCYHAPTKTTPLPHKTIARFAGLGWIGKHNLLVTPEFGSALSMCTVLTDAPLSTVLHTPATSRCGQCRVCQQVCSVNALTGNTWTVATSRDALLDVEKCTTCLKCLVFCPWTQQYMKHTLEGRCSTRVM